MNAHKIVNSLLESDVKALMAKYLPQAPQELNFTSAQGIPMRARMQWPDADEIQARIRRCMGHVSSLTHQPVVALLDMSRDTERGQPIASYYATTLVAHRGSLVPHLDISVWDIDAAAMERMRTWIRTVWPAVDELIRHQDDWLS